MQRISEQPEFPVNRRNLSRYLFTTPEPRRQASVAVRFLILLLLATIPALNAKDKTRKEEYGVGYTSDVAASISDVLQAVDDVINDGMIQGSKEYNKDKYIDKASPASGSSLFPAWTGPGKVFYKVRENVLAPINFKESNDEGTLAVRYIVQEKTPQHTTVRIDAVFAEDFRRIVHPSNGSVESAEFKDIQDHVDALQLQKKQAAESERHRQEELAKQSLERKNQEAEAAALANAQLSSQTLEQRVVNLRHQLERAVKAPGAQLKSAPFQTATNLKSLDPGSQVIILIVTPYWYGVETEDGEHGWVNHAQLEPLQ